MANPIQQGLKPRLNRGYSAPHGQAAMANPIQQGLKPVIDQVIGGLGPAAMANPIQQGLKRIATNQLTVGISCRNG